jgi:hypothetical protein
MSGVSECTALPSPQQKGKAMHHREQKQPVMHAGRQADRPSTANQTLISHIYHAEDM